jgi:hypothetical protein
MDTESQRIYDRMRLHNLQLAQPTWSPAQLAATIGCSERWLTCIHVPGAISSADVLRQYTGRAFGLLLISTAIPKLPSSRPDELSHLL